MKVVVRCIYYKAVTPSCDIIDMDNETWREFLYAKDRRRIEIALKLLGREEMDTYVRELAWILFDGQTKIIENKK
jgi:hypothetical protein